MQQDRTFDTKLLSSVWSFLFQWLLQYACTAYNSADPLGSQLYLDLGASHHLAADLANLNVKADEYRGPNQIRIGDGLRLTVKHIGSTQGGRTQDFKLGDAGDKWKKKINK